MVNRLIGGTFFFTIVVMCAGCYNTQDKSDLSLPKEKEDAQDKNSIIVDTEEVGVQISGGWGERFPLRIEMRPTSAELCEGQCVDILVSATGGSPPYLFYWDGERFPTSDSRTVCPESDTTYSVIVRDTGLVSEEFTVLPDEIERRITVTVDDNCGQKDSPDASIDTNVFESNDAEIEADSGDAGTETDSSDAYKDQCIKERDGDADGIVEDRWIYTYDANGNIVTEDHDYGADGTIAYRITYTFDADGNMVVKETDDYADGTVEQRHTYTYDADGNMLTVEFPPDGRVVYSYDADGNRLTEWQDLVNVGGRLDAYYFFYYDAYGNLLTEEQDVDGDGTVDFRHSYAYTYDADGNVLTEVVDLNDDGTVVRYTYTYDADGNVLTMDRDLDADGVLERRTTYTYNADGDLLMEERDSNFDGAVDLRKTYNYDTVRNILTYEVDREPDGEPNDRYTYACTSGGIERLRSAVNNIY